MTTTPEQLMLDLGEDFELTPEATERAIKQIEGFSPMDRLMALIETLGLEVNGYWAEDGDPRVDTVVEATVEIKGHPLLCSLVGPLVDFVNESMNDPVLQG